MRAFFPKRWRTRAAAELDALAPPEQLAESILAKDRRIAEILGNVKGLLAGTK